MRICCAYDSIPFPSFADLSELVLKQSCRDSPWFPPLSCSPHAPVINPSFTTRPSCPRDVRHAMMQPCPSQSSSVLCVLRRAVIKRVESVSEAEYILGASTRMLATDQTGRRGMMMMPFICSCRNKK